MKNLKSSTNYLGEAISGRLRLVALLGGLAMVLLLSSAGSVSAAPEYRGYWYNGVSLTNTCDTYWPGSTYAYHVWGLADYGREEWAVFCEKDTAPAPTPTPVPVGGKLTHSEAINMLANAGITTIVSTDNCSNRNVKTCTSLDQVRRASIEGLIAFKQRCDVVMGDCTIHVTGGTETGHSNGTYSHWKGYKIDISNTFGSGDNYATRYIKNNFTYEGESYGSMYRDPVTGYSYALESNHWDICFDTNCYRSNRAAVAKDEPEQLAMSAMSQEEFEAYKAEVEMFEGEILPTAVSLNNLASNHDATRTNLIALSLLIVSAVMVTIVRYRGVSTQNR